MNWRGGGYESEVAVILTDISAPFFHVILVPCKKCRWQAPFCASWEPPGAPEAARSDHTFILMDLRGIRGPSRPFIFASWDLLRFRIETSLKVLSTFINGLRVLRG